MKHVIKLPHLSFAVQGFDFCMVFLPKIIKVIRVFLAKGLLIRRLTIFEVFFWEVWDVLLNVCLFFCFVFVFCFFKKYGKISLILWSKLF